MIATLDICTAREQSPLSTKPYDRWVNPEGETMAEFHRLPAGHLVRYLDQADFEIVAASSAITCHPVPGTSTEIIERLFANAIKPLLANHEGRLCLHGSAVVIDGEAVAFMGESRRGKTTLAAAFARAGFPFLTEDVVALRREGGSYVIEPQRPVLRLFADSARYVLGHAGPATGREKHDYAACAQLPHADAPAPLSRVYLLGPGDAPKPLITRGGPAAALAAMLPNAFILDIEDQTRLRAHFGRLGELAARAPFFALDYPRTFHDLPQVIEAVREHLEVS